MNDYSREQLEKLSYKELHEIEDELLFENEVSGKWRIRASAGRMLYFVLTSIFWFCWFWGVDKFIPKSEARGLIQFVWFFVSMLLAGLTTTLFWKLIGMKGRQFIRLSLHYWPVTIALAITISHYLKGKV